MLFFHMYTKADREVQAGKLFHKLKILMTLICFYKGQLHWDKSVRWFSEAFLTSQVDGSSADPVGERPEDDVPDQKPSEEQRSS